MTSVFERTCASLSVSPQPVERKRMVYSSSIPFLSKEDIFLRWGVPPDDEVYVKMTGRNVWVLPMVAEEISPLYVKVQGRMVGATLLDRSAREVFNKKNWFEVYRDLQVLVPGPVKNFLVAVRTWTGTPQANLRVLIRGSKAVSKGGLWHNAFGLWLLRSVENVHIDLYDQGEVPQEVVLRYDNETRYCQLVHHVGLYEGKGETYDVVIDDAYDAAEHAPVKWQPVSEFYSLKVHGQGKPFLHQTESRYFSHEPVNTFRSPCPCNVCGVCSSMSRTYGDFTFLRGMCTVFGAGPCALREMWEDLSHKGRVFSDIMSLPSKMIVLPGDFRGVMALLDEVPIVAYGPHEVGLAMKDDVRLEISDYKHKEGFVVTESLRRIVYPWLVGRKVSFVGVNPAVLGATKILYGLSTKRGHDVIVFANSMETLLSGVLPEVVYLPMVESIVGYVRTGRAVAPFFEYERVPIQEEMTESLYSLGLGHEVSGEVMWTTVVPGLYKIKPSHVSIIGSKRVFVAPSPGMEEMNLCPYRFSVPTSRVLKGRGFADYIKDLTLDPGEWDRYRVVPYSPSFESQDLRVRFVQGGTWYVTSRNLSKCYYQVTGDKFTCSDCPDHLHFKRQLGGGECAECHEDRFYVVVEGRNGYSKMVCMKTPKISALYKHTGKVVFSYNGTIVDDTNLLSYLGMTLQGDDGFVIGGLMPLGDQKAVGKGN